MSVKEDRNVLSAKIARTVCVTVEQYSSRVRTTWIRPRKRERVVADAALSFARWYAKELGVCLFFSCRVLFLSVYISVAVATKFPPYLTKKKILT